VLLDARSKSTRLPLPPKNISFDTRASASANDFTNKFYPEGIGRGILDDINQAITHLQYGRKSQPQETLDTWTMLRVKEHIDREIDNFEGAMTSDYKSAWKPRPRPQQILVYELASATNATTFATLLLVPGNR